MLGLTYAVLVILVSIADGIPEARVCKSVPGSASWPSQVQWDAFNDTISSRLIKPTPPAAVCHRGWPTYDSEDCKVVREGWNASALHSNDPVSGSWTNFDENTCLPWEGAACNVTGYPTYVVNASTTAHVKLAVDFARENNIRLVVKSSGHDFLGR
jgi:hypothetical protein